ncbi:MAG: ornithine carbamoyltransferase [Dehalococcoidia bacterium]|nr:ornithine carbamoyltransferase [Dehalococcoidia bacterium]
MAPPAKRTSTLYGRDVLSFEDLAPDEVQHLLRRALALKGGKPSSPLARKTLALLFEKPSLRTRASFDVAMEQIGGHALYLGPQEVGLGTREPASDVGRVLSRYVDAIACRTFAQRTLEELARAASVPVINALSDQEHPCQALADILTVLEVKGRLDLVTVAFVGDGNNCAASLALAIASVGGCFRIASPGGYGLPGEIVRRAQALARKTGGSVEAAADPRAAVQGADVVYTDVWTSMGREAEAAARRGAFAGYQVNAKLLTYAKKDAVVMHPMPAHYGEEVPPGFLEGPRSIAYQQAENRLHAQKALLEAVLAR